MEANLRTRLGGFNGILKRSLGFYERKEEVVAFTDDYSSAIYRRLDCHVERIGSCSIYLYSILRRDHYD
jgi:hypothetical protein